MTLTAAGNDLWVDVEELPREAFAEVHRRMIFDCCKWDPQVGDVSVLSPFALVLRESAWREVSRLAEGLSAEVLSAEAELSGMPWCHEVLGVPRRIRRAFRGGGGATAGAARVIRFDFHPTREGWRISEANTDVPGAFNEASGLSRLMAAHYPRCDCAGDPAEALAGAIIEAAGEGARVGLVHATAYTDDRQVMTYLGGRWASRGLRPYLVGPDHLRWEDGRARVASRWYEGPLDFVFRFYPAEWLANLPRVCRWQQFFSGGRTPVSNPGAALLTQSKRFPLVWDRLRTSLPTWRAVLPETVDPRALNGQAGEEWVLKPTFGRVGESVGIEGVTAAKEMSEIRRAARRWPLEWAAQRRFEVVPLVRGGRTLYPCLGVYTVGGRVAGAYGRVSGSRLINHESQEAAVLVRREGLAAEAERER